MIFKDWIEPYKSGEKTIPDHIHEWLREAWNAADKAAREECAWMCKEISREIDNSDSYYFNLDFKDGKVAGSDQCEEAIRASIRDESLQPENSNDI